MQSSSRIFHRSIVVISLLFVTLSAHLVEAKHVTNPVTHKRRRVLIVGLDGARGDVVQAGVEQGLLPALQTFARMGQLSTQAQTHDLVGAFVTVPGWTSVLTGVGPLKHGVLANNAGMLHNPMFPSLLRSAKSAGLRTWAAGQSGVLAADPSHAAIDGECWFYETRARAFGYGDTDSCNLTQRYRTDKDADASAGDVLLYNLVSDHVADADADVVFAVADAVDAEGHATGFNGNIRSPYGQAAQRADDGLLKVIRAAEHRARVTDEEWLILTTADHGGHAQTHGNQAQDRQIFFGLLLYGAQESLDPLSATVRHTDVNPTVLHFLGLPTPGLRDGQAQGMAHIPAGLLTD